MNSRDENVIILKTRIEAFRDVRDDIIERTQYIKDTIAKAPDDEYHKGRLQANEVTLAGVEARIDVLVDLLIGLTGRKE